MRSHTRYLLLALLVFAAVAHVRGQEDDDETPVKTTAKKTTKATPKNVAAETKPAGTTEEEKKKPSGGVAANISAAKLYMYTAMRDYSTLPRRYTIERKECAQIPINSGLPEDVLLLLSLVWNAENGSELARFHAEKRKESLEAAKAIGCEEEANIFWENATMLVDVVITAHDDVLRQAQRTYAQQQQQKKTEAAAAPAEKRDL